MSNIVNQDNLFNELCHTTLINIYTLSKDDNTIILNFNKSKEYLFFINCAISAAVVFNRKLYLTGNFFYYIYYVIKYFGFKEFKNIHYSFNKPNIDVMDVLKFEAEANKVDVKIFERIYDTYYVK